MCRVSSRLNNKRAFARVRNVLQTCVLTRLPVKWRRKFRIDVRDGPWVVPTVGVTFTGRRQRKPHISARSRVRARNGMHELCEGMMVCVAQKLNVIWVVANFLCWKCIRRAWVNFRILLCFARYLTSCLEKSAAVHLRALLSPKRLYCAGNEPPTYYANKLKSSVLSAWSATSSCKIFACYHKLRKLCGPSN